jgi:asparagine synthase (glutamine-hydrolysing)
MNNIPPPPQTQPDAFSQRPWARWLTMLTGQPPVQVPGMLCKLLAGDGRSRQLHLITEIGSEPPAHGSQAECAVVFDGALYNRSELEDELGAPPDLPNRNVAEVILAGYLRWGKDLLPRLRGPFALVIWDANREVLLGVRDPLGNHPLFFAEAQGQVLVSPAIDLLTKQPPVSRDLNRLAMADFVMQRTLGSQDTFFKDVRRIPAGHAICFERKVLSHHRYWDPAVGGKVNWTGPAEVERFDELFDRAVNRCLSFGPAGIFLSGGLDSVAVAAAAIDLCRKEHRPQPLALSLLFPDPEANEEAVQRSVAEQLGMPQVVKPFFEATGENGLLRSALAMSRSLSAPLLNAWLPAYTTLAKEGTRRGCKVIVTGGGGDEWLGVGPFLAADLLRALDLVGMFRLWKGLRLSYRISGLALLRSLVWKYGAKPLLLPPTYKFIKRRAPWAIQLRHRLSPTPPTWLPPQWVAPDPSLRRQFEERAAQSNGDNKPRAGSHYVHAGKKSLDHPMISWELEELFEVYRGVGVRVLQPFWDADLVDLLFRMPPFVLNRGGRSKGLVRDSLARRFPDLGFERQRKVLGVNFYRSLVEQDGANIWRELGGAKALKSLGVIDEKGLEGFLKPRLDRPRDARDAHEVLTVLNLESWTRSQMA